MDPSSSIFKPYQDYECWRGDRQTVLKSSIGRQLPYIVNFKKNTCQIFDIALERITHSFAFPESAKLVDVDYFPTEDGHFGILVGVEDELQTWGSESFIVALVADPEERTMRATHSLSIPVKITVVKTLFSALDMAEGRRQKTLGLYRGLLEWNHVIAVGCKESTCYLARMTPIEASPGASVPIHDSKKSRISLMGVFITDGNLRYSQDDGCYRDYPISAVYISALALMPRSRTLLVGLSMGGILAAALNPSNQMVFLELRHERLIRELAPLEPEDDPDKFEYFIAAVDRSSRHPVMIQLWRGSFKTLEEVDDSVKYDRPHYAVCLEHKIPYGERWLAVNPIVTERGNLETRRRDDSMMDSMLNSSQSYGCSANRSHVLLAYERRKLTTTTTELPEFVVEAAIFDIDAWYYKRVPGGVSTDGTALRQCAFMSSIKSDINSDQVQDIGILTLVSTDVFRFPSLVSDADQLFYPSALSYDRVFVVGNNQISWMKIQSLQQTILDKCASKLSWIIRSPDAMASDILAAGLVRKSILTGSPNSSAVEISNSDLSTDQKIILNAMVYYGKIEEFCTLATRNDLSDKLKTEIAQWAVHEAVDYKRIISDRTVTLFDGSAVALSPLAEDTVIQGIKLFRVVYEYLRTCAKTVKDGARLNSLAHSVKCLRNHTKLTSRFISVRIVPGNYHTQQVMREMHEKKKNQALKNKSALPVQLVTRNMHRLAPDSQFWNDMPYDEWYPPTPLDLLESILTVNIPERAKRELIVQYVLDWLRADPEHAEDSDKQLALETIKVITDTMLDVSLEKIYYILDEEKAALRKRVNAVLNDDGVATKVFSLQDDGLSYEKLWNGEVHLATTIGKKDLERFEQRLKTQMEEGKKRKLAILDPETEMLYQMFLFENQKYDLMSSDAIESNTLLRMFQTAMVRKTGKGPMQNSGKGKEIEQSVKAMFEKQEKNDESEIPEVFAAIEKGRKRKSEGYDGSTSSTSPITFVPPTAKRIQHVGRSQSQINQNDNTTAVQNTTTTSSILSPADPQRNAELNMMIATPARYYKRPITVNVDMVSPPTQRLPPVTAQNSILKTAKAVQSPSRGRIRFHESVRRGANESVDSTEERQEEEEEAPRPKGLNFAILEDEEEEDISTRRSTSMKEKLHVNDRIDENEEEEEDEEDEPIEKEKSFEHQEEPENQTFDVLENVPKENSSLIDTFEMRTDDVMPGTNETFELTEDMSEKTAEVQEDEVPEEEGLQNTNQKDMAETEEKTEEIQTEDEPEDVGSTSEIQEDIEEEVPKDTDILAEEQQQEEEAPWDGVHRSFELQKDEDCVPVDAVNDENQFEDAHDELIEDVPLNRTFEVQDDCPQPRADVPNYERPVIEASVERAAKVQKAEEKIPEPVQEEDRPPSANTRLAAKRAADSRSATPEEVNEKSETLKSTTRKTRATSVQKTSEIQEDPDSRSPSRGRSRATSVQKSSEVQVDESDSGLARAPTVVKKATKVRENEEEVPRTPSKRSRAASVKRNAPVEEEEEPTKTPKKTPRAKAASAKSGNTEEKDEDVTMSTAARKTRAGSVKKQTFEEKSAEIADEEDLNTTAKRTRASSVRRSVRSRTTSEVAAPDELPRTTRSRPGSRATTPSRSTRAKKTLDDEPPADEIELPDVGDSMMVKQVRAKRTPSSRATSETPKAATRSASKRHVSVTVDSAIEEEPAKKQRGRPRNTPLKVIPEISEEPLTSSKNVTTPTRGGSRLRNPSVSSTSATVPTTPKRGKKATLEEVIEENDETELTKSVRRSTRRTTHQP